MAQHDTTRLDTIYGGGVQGLCVSEMCVMFICVMCGVPVVPP